MKGTEYFVSLYTSVGITDECNIMVNSKELIGILRLKCDGTHTETRFRLSAKRTSPFKSARASVQSTTGSRGVHISGSNAGYTLFRGSLGVLATHSIRQFPLHFPSRASPYAIRFQLDSTTEYLTQQMRCHIDQCHYNSIQLYSVPNVASIMIHDILYIHNIVQTFCCQINKHLHLSPGRPFSCM
jgi:hypothetical protein